MRRLLFLILGNTSAKHFAKVRQTT